MSFLALSTVANKRIVSTKEFLAKKTHRSYKSSQNQPVPQFSGLRGGHPSSEMKYSSR